MRLILRQRYCTPLESFDVGVETPISGEQLSRKKLKLENTEEAIPDTGDGNVDDFLFSLEKELGGPPVSV